MVEHSNDHKLRHTWLLKHKFGLMGNSFVVYFDQRTHACACVRMVENDQNHCKMSEKVLFHHAYERLTRGLRTKTKKKVWFMLKKVRKQQNSK